MAQKIIEFNPKESAKKTAEAITASQNAQKALFESLMKNIQEINPALGGFEELATLLQLPEEQFAIIGPIFIEELQKSYNNTDDKMLLIQSMNASGKKIEELQAEYQILINQIDEKMNDILSAQKRDFLKMLLGLTYNAIHEAEGVARRVVNIPIELTDANAKMPKYAHLGDGALDLYCPEEVTIQPGETKIIPVNIKVALPYGYAFLIHPRSGTSARSKLRIANSIGLVDSQYKGVIGVIVENIDPKIRDIDYEFDDNGHPIITSILHGSPITIGKGERFAQMRLVEVPTAAFVQVKSVDGIGDDRGGGFGSSGVK